MPIRDLYNITSQYFTSSGSDGTKRKAILVATLAMRFTSLNLSADGAMPLFS